MSYIRQQASTVAQINQEFSRVQKGFETFSPLVAHYKGSFDAIGALSPIVRVNITGLFVASMGRWYLDLVEPMYLDAYGATLHNPADATKFYSCIPRPDLPDTKATRVYFSVFEGDGVGGISHVTGSGSLDNCIVEFYAQERFDR